MNRFPERPTGPTEAQLKWASAVGRVHRFNIWFRFVACTLFSPLFLLSAFAVDSRWQAATQVLVAVSLAWIATRSFKSLRQPKKGVSDPV